MVLTLLQREDARETIHLETQGRLYVHMTRALEIVAWIFSSRMNGEVIKVFTYDHFFPSLTLFPF